MLHALRVRKPYDADARSAAQEAEHEQQRQARAFLVFVFDLAAVEGAGIVPPVLAF